jgi:hypothetical protein
MNEVHCISFKDNKVLSKIVGHIDHLMKEATEIQMHPNNFNTDMLFTQSGSWNPATNII